MFSTFVVHPVIWVVSFFVLASAVALGGPEQLLAAGVVLGILYLVRRVHPALANVKANGAWIMLRRMRWFFLSLLVIYGWFTPGQPVFPSYPPALFSYLPTIEGIAQGGLRLAALILLVIAVHVLLQITSREQLVAAIDWFVGPLRWVGVRCDRLALRMVLTLETVVPAQQVLSRSVALANAVSNPLLRISNAAARVFEEIIERAECAPAQTVQIPGYGQPPIYQWFYPLILGTVFWLIG